MRQSKLFPQYKAFKNIKTTPFNDLKRCCFMLHFPMELFLPLTKSQKDRAGYENISFREVNLIIYFRFNYFGRIALY